MSDRTGVLCFENFDIVDAPECHETAEEIRRYLVGRALTDVDVSQIREIGRDGHALCARVVAQLVTESQGIFVHGHVLSDAHRSGERTATAREGRA
jgi:hypothetical protein